MEICTIGFTKRSAAAFFEALSRARITRLIDVRLHNTSQLAGFAKRDDLAYFLRELCDAAYVHEPRLAPSADLLQAYRHRRLSWDQYAEAYLLQLGERTVESSLDPMLFAGPTALLCAEPSADRCHRRLAVDYLATAWGGITPRHL